MPERLWLWLRIQIRTDGRQSLRAVRSWAEPRNELCPTTVESQLAQRIAFALQRHLRCSAEPMRLKHGKDHFDGAAGFVH